MSFQGLGLLSELHFQRPRKKDQRTGLSSTKKWLYYIRTIEGHLRRFIKL